MTLMTFVYLIAGLVLLVAGAEVLVRGAARLAAQFGIPPLIVSRQLIRLDVPLMIGASLVTWALALDGSLGRLDGALLFVGVVAYTLFLIIGSRKDKSAAAGDEFADEFGLHETPKPYAWAINLALLVAGLVLLVSGSNLLVEGAVTLAKALGLSELVIGLTIIAVGTSLPELATSMIAAFKGERDIAVGNVVGSNLFNLLCVLGLASLLSPLPINVSANALSFDFPVMIAVAVACLPIFFAGYCIRRWEGALFVAYYAIYTVWLIMHSTDAPGLAMFSQAMLWFVLPLTAVTLLVIGGRAWKLQR